LGRGGRRFESGQPDHMVDGRTLLSLFCPNGPW
jgi:hypothetical protein